MSQMCLALWPQALQADPARPDAPRSRVNVYDADLITCRPQQLEAGFRSHMAPWADQPEEVQRRLRMLQGELTRNSLRHCLSRGLITPEEASSLERRLGLTASPAQPDPSPKRP